MLLNNDLGIADVADCIVVSMRPDLGDEGMQQLMQALSQRLMLGRQHAVLLDFSGVMLLDHHEFRQVRKLAEVCRLLGAVCCWLGSMQGSPPSWRCRCRARAAALLSRHGDAFAHVRRTLKDEE